MIIRSPYPDVTIPDLPLAQFILRGATDHADKPALIDGAIGAPPFIIASQPRKEPVMYTRYTIRRSGIRHWRRTLIAPPHMTNDNPNRATGRAPYTKET